MAMSALAGRPVEPTATADRCAAWSGWSRQITDVDTLSDSAGDWSRTCTEDVCPVDENKAECAKGPDLLPPQRVELRLQQGGSSLSYASAASVADLRRAVSDATGKEPEHVQLCEGITGRGRALLDHELVPSLVVVIGVDRLPGGGVVLGRQLFMRTLLDLKKALSAVHLEEAAAPGGVRSARSTTKEDVFRSVCKDAEDRGQVFFESFTDMDSFYCTSAFSANADFRAVYAEINALVEKFRGTNELLGGGGGLIGA